MNLGRVLACAALALTLAVPTARAETPNTARVWVYGAGTLQLDPTWSVTAITGSRFELARSGGGQTKDHYLDEVFVGPNWSRRFLDGALGLKVSLQYYFIGYPKRANAGYPLSHNLELVPTVDYRLGAFNLSWRAIFHNTFHASVYPAGQRWGYGMVLRNLVALRWAASERLTLLVGDEPWLGVVENSGTAYSAAGYWKSGFRLNRVYAGVEWKQGPVSVSPQYVFEATMNDEGSLAELGHYAFVTFAYTCSL